MRAIVDDEFADVLVAVAALVDAEAVAVGVLVGFGALGVLFGRGAVAVAEAEAAAEAVGFGGAESVVARGLGDAVLGWCACCAGVVALW